MINEQRLIGKVALVTGAGGGIGRAHALELAAQGAQVIVNDRGGAVTGEGPHQDAALAVVREITDAGGTAIGDSGDVADWSDAEAMVEAALSRFGRLDIVVNNAGILRPRTIVGMGLEDIESVIRVHLLGSFAVTHFAACHWRERAKGGEPGGRLINTTSGSGLFGIGQANYAAAKAGIAALTQVAAGELERYGVTANAVAPTAETRMSAGIVPPGFAVHHVSRLVAWLASGAAREVTGRVFQVGGGHISIIDGWHLAGGIDEARGWSLAELDAAMPALIARGASATDITGYKPDDERSALLPAFELPGAS